MERKSYKFALLIVLLSVFTSCATTSKAQTDNTVSTEVNNTKNTTVEEPNYLMINENTLNKMERLSEIKIVQVPVSE